METKVCARCKQDKTSAEFSKDAQNKDGLASWCRPCRAEYMREYHKKRGHRPARTPAEGVQPLPFAKTPIKGKANDHAKEQRNLTELAHMTHMWARNKILAVKGEGGHGYFTVDEWCTHFGQSRSTWLKVQRELQRLGYPLCLDGFRGGFYFGTPEEHAITVTAAIKTMLAYVENVMGTMGAVSETTGWDELSKLVAERLEGSRYEAALKDLPRIADSARVPVSANFERKLLVSGS